MQTEICLAKNCFIGMGLILGMYTKMKWFPSRIQYRRYRALRLCEKVASDLGLSGGFRRVLRFPSPVTTG